MKKYALWLCIFYTTNYPMSYTPSFTNPDLFLGEPRLTKNWLTTVDLILKGGHGLKGFNGCRQSVNALNIYGCENFHMLAKGVPDSVLNCNPDGFINNLWQQDATLSNFGQVCLAGKYSLLEFDLILAQNFLYGLFLSLYIPVQKEAIRGFTICDQTTKKSAPTPALYYQWQSFINNIECNLQKYDVYIGNCKMSGLSDIQLFGGWSFSHENTTHIDFLDFTTALGVNIPTGKSCPLNAPFCLSLGYDGNLGIPFIAMISIGLWDWLTLGLDGAAMWFKDTTSEVAMKTAFEQSGCIRLASDDANVKLGTMWSISPYLKLDHLIGGLSALFAFSYDHGNRSYITPCDPTYDINIVNCDQRLLSWDMTSFHFILDFDLASFKHPWAPHLAFIIDKAIYGKRVFDSAIFGAEITFDIEW